MKRLREIQTSDPRLRTVQHLLEAIEPSPDPTERLPHLRRALERRSGHSAAAKRVSTLVVAFLLAACAASAAYGAARALAPWRAQAAQHAHDLPARLEATTRPAPAGRATSVTPDEPETTGRSASEPEPLPRARPVGMPQKPTALPATASDSEFVLLAVKALRQDRDPARAARLLEMDHIRHANGPLAEESLSLRIEATLALHDPRAASLAREYLARYPAGRYRDVAEKALDAAALP